MKAKRLIAMLLCAMMLFSVLPAAAFADGDEEIIEVAFGTEAEEMLPEESAEEYIPEEEEEQLPADEEEIPEEDEEPAEEIPAEDEESAEKENLPEEPETEESENEFEVALIDSGSCGGVDWEFYNSGELIIKGSGLMDDFGSENPGWIKYYKAITSLYFDGNITRIGAYAFANLENLSYVELPANLTVIYDNAFRNDSALGSIEFPATLKYIGKQAFGYCYGLTSVSFTGAAPEIEDDAFEFVTATAYYPLGIGGWRKDKLQNYGGNISWVISNVPTGSCGTGLTWIFKDGKLSISGSGSMDNYKSAPYSPWHEFCDRIETVEIAPGLKSIGEFAFWLCENLKSISIPEGVVTINRAAFDTCTAITEITLPESVKIIEGNAFGNCDSLARINIPYGVTKIEEYTFNACKNLKSIRIPESVIYIGQCAFINDGLETVTIPNSIKSIPNDAFNKCRNLKSVVIPEGVTTIGVRAFAYCSSLGKISIPASVTLLGKDVFDDCFNLTAINVASGNKAYKSVDGVLFNISGTELIKYPNGRTGTYTVPAGVTDIAYAFKNCKMLTGITLPGSLTEIGTFTFYGCSTLASVTLSEGLMNIGRYAFYYCESLAEMTFPKTLLKIDADAFTHCKKLSTLRFLGNAPLIDIDAFLGMNSDAYYPQGDSTWTEAIKREYSANIKWIPYGGHPMPIIQIPANHENYMIIQWSKCEGATGYRLNYREGSGPWTEVKVGLTQVNSKGEPRWDYKDAKDGLTYTFMVYADFADGTSTQSERVGQMRLRTPKITVKHFGGSDSTGGFRVDWEATTGGSQYKIYYREKGGTWALYTMIPKTYNVLFTNIKASITNTSPNLPDLIAGHTYEFMVLTCTSVASVTSGFPTPFVSMKF